MKEYSVAFCPTAGGKQLIEINGRPAPFPLYWPILKWILDILQQKGFSIHIQLLNNLKPETVDRVLKLAEVCRQREISHIILAGGSSTRSIEIVDQMKELLLNHVGEGWHSEIISDGTSVQTEENVHFGFRILLNSLGDDEIITRVALVTSWYHLLRTHKAIRGIIPKAKITWYPVFPRLTKECLKHEYLYNMLSEPLKLVLSTFPKFMEWYGKRERLSRKL